MITSDDPGESRIRWQRLLTEPLRLAVPQISLPISVARFVTVLGASGH
ncbi:MAG TPA: hypothetical protein VF070_01965 [Streptosporangiaceae bacterium]